MRAEYDSEADALSIRLAEPSGSVEADQVHDRVIVAISAGIPVDVELLYPALGIAEALAVAAAKYDLDQVALEAAAHAAIAAPDRPVKLDVGATI